MSKEYTNYQTLVQGLSKIKQEFEDLKAVINARVNATRALLVNFEGAAASTYEEVSSALINFVAKAEERALGYLNSDINTWYDQLDDAEKSAANTFKSEIGL